MAYTVPVGEIWLLKNIPWGKDYKHTKYFSSASAQHSFICDSSRIIGSSNPKTAQNQIKDPLSGSIKIAGHQENYLGCSYICFVNTSIEGALPADHTYNYAFVDDVRYISNNVFEIDYTIDVFQTYLFQGGCSVDKAFIKRTHTQTDELGSNAHLEPEPLGFGDYTYSKLSSLIVDTSWKYLIFSALDLTQVSPQTQTKLEEMNLCYPYRGGGIIQGVYVYVCDSYVEMSNKIGGLRQGLAEAIIAVVAVPAGFVNRTNDDLITPSAEHKSEATGRYTNIDGYAPTNKKVLAFPYNMLHISNLEGTEKDYRWEYFADVNDIHFELWLSVTPDPELIAIPENYAGLAKDYDGRVTLNNFPHITWMSSYFKQWQQDKGLQTIVGSIAGGALAGFNIASPAEGSHPIKSAISGAGLGSVMAGMEFAKAQCHPNGYHGSGQGQSALFTAGVKNIYALQKCINANDARRIDNYFSRYGYAINKIENVHFTNPRFNQHYVQTAEVIISGGAPASVIRTISDAFNAGITFWKNTVGDYTL